MSRFFKVVLWLALLLSLSSGLRLPEEQQNIELALLQNSSITIFLILQNDAASLVRVNLTCAGDCKHLRFGGELAERYGLEMYPYSQVFLPVTLIAHDRLGEYEVIILANDAAISRIKMLVTLSPEDVQQLVKERDEAKQITELLLNQTAKLTSLINRSFSSLYEVLGLINETLVTEVRENLANLTEQVKKLGKTSSYPTGAAVVSVSTLGIAFAGGVVVGFLLTKRSELARRLRLKFVKKGSHTV